MTDKIELRFKYFQEILDEHIETANSIGYTLGEITFYRAGINLGLREAIRLVQLHPEIL